jgi:hypothetical protein
MDIKVTSYYSWAKQVVRSVILKTLCLPFVNDVITYDDGCLGSKIVAGTLIM